jgi:hypothetical protein
MGDAARLVVVVVHLINVLLRPMVQVCLRVMEEPPIGNVACVTMVP